MQTNLAGASYLILTLFLNPAVGLPVVRGAVTHLPPVAISGATETTGTHPASATPDSTVCAVLEGRLEARVAGVHLSFSGVGLRVRGHSRGSIEGEVRGVLRSADAPDGSTGFSLDLTIGEGPARLHLEGSGEAPDQPADVRPVVAALGASTFDPAGPMKGSLLLSGLAFPDDRRAQLVYHGRVCSASGGETAIGGEES